MKHITLRFIVTCTILGTLGLSSCTKKEKQQFDANQADTSKTVRHPGMDK